MKDFNEREDFLPGRALSEDARNKRNDRAPNRFSLRTCDVGDVSRPAALSQALPASMSQ